jgi:hypothetical protein
MGQNSSHGYALQRVQGGRRSASDHSGTDASYVRAAHSTRSLYGRLHTILIVPIKRAPISGPTWRYRSDDLSNPATTFKSVMKRLSARRRSAEVR